MTLNQLPLRHTPVREDMPAGSNRASTLLATDYHLKVKFKVYAHDRELADVDQCKLKVAGTSRSTSQVGWLVIDRAKSISLVLNF